MRLIDVSREGRSCLLVGEMIIVLGYGMRRGGRRRWRRGMLGVLSLLFALVQMAGRCMLARLIMLFTSVPIVGSLSRFSLTVTALLQVYDIRKHQEVFTLRGHTDTPSSLSLSPFGTHVLSPSFSSNTIIWDVRPFSPSPDRIHRVLQGAPAGFESLLSKGAWSREDGGKRVAVGGADRTVTIWEVESGRVLYKVRLDALRGTTRLRRSWLLTVYFRL